ncbi:aromatic ring-hydroxylating oxygenase subunit alpha [Stakelama tenebrarum]|uniref:Aromatic ring-hydroxylating dioxygenase subunit alpha n=1 Tax=Stakelama tenebrarum TaxID=2711215 RepID=A0A6G6Y620_9SPHN|nr:aromatic ring-hydroxylating dioxygenase subunit alpha [Sphingosinithalassobacter tenebrarum]QIG80168.1 aromatic ring-hydroxylating dioxygenase subunit alpha [Sphingosinithalassobacter tenebrarum]
MERSLLSSDYLDPAFWEWEKAEIHGREWFCVAREEDVPTPGSHRQIDVLGENILLVRDRAGELHAHYNVCRHRGARICDAANDAKWGLDLNGGVIGGVIRCPYHGWAYGLDGALLATPGMAPGAVDKKALGLHPCGVATWGGFVFITLRPETAPDFEAALGEAPRRLSNYPLEALRTGETRWYDVDANWKVILENYNECYHCGPVHPELCEIVPDFLKNAGMHLDWEAGVPHREGAVTFTRSGTTSRDFFPGLSEEEKVRHKGELIFPNLMFSLSSDHAAAFLLWPDGPGRTRIECRFLFHESELAKPGFDPADAVEFWDLVNRQDWAVCERVQRGMAARVHEFGYYSPLEDYSLDIRRYIAERRERSA